MNNRFTNSLYSAAIGDILGTPFQFLDRKDIPETLDFDTWEEYKQERFGTSIPYMQGLWSDDTSLTLATMNALFKTNGKEKIDRLKMIVQEFVRWLYKGKYTQTQKAWDIGQTTKCSINAYIYDKGDFKLLGSKEPENSGNGSLMRFLPIPFILYKDYGLDALSDRNNIDFVKDISSITHGSLQCVYYCLAYTQLMLCILDGMQKDTLIQEACRRYRGYIACFSSEYFRNVYTPDSFKQGYFDKPMSEINSSTYVINTFNAALWCFMNTNSAEECIWKCIRLGGDTDTIACIAGGIAGAYYNKMDRAYLERIYKKNILDKYLIDFQKII